MSAVVAVDLFKEQIWNNKWIKRRIKMYSGCNFPSTIYFNIRVHYIECTSCIWIHFSTQYYIIDPTVIFTPRRILITPWRTSKLIYAQNENRFLKKNDCDFSNGLKWFYASAYFTTSFNNFVNYQNIPCINSGAALRLL